MNNSERILLENAMWKAAYNNAVEVEKEMEEILKNGLSEYKPSFFEKLLSLFGFKF